MRNLLLFTADGRRVLLGSPGTDYSFGPGETAVAAAVTFDPNDEESGVLVYVTRKNIDSLREWLDENFPRDVR